MRTQSKLIIGGIISLFACSAVAHTRRGWQSARHQESSSSSSRTEKKEETVRGYAKLRQNKSRRPTTQDVHDDDAFVVLDEQEATELYDTSDFSSVEGAFEWNKFQAPGYAQHIQDDDNNDANDGMKFYIVNQRDVQRRLQDRRSLNTDNTDSTFDSHRQYDASSEDGIYTAGDVQDYSVDTISTLLRSHEKVAFTQKWRGADRLIVTQLCSIQFHTKHGAYYCVDNQTVCVTVQAMPRFYGDHVTGGRCGTLPMDENEIASLPESFKHSYVATIEGGKCK
jgi:hypothetical protein